nr:DUF3365 domain-containing protein [uncultured Desulfuromonas sp.]
MRALAILLLTAFMCLPVSAQTSAPHTAAQQHIGTFQKTLMKELKQGLAQGTAHAISVCRSRAPQIAAELSQNGIKIGRTTSRLRNPLNNGPAWTTPYLDYYQNLPEKGDMLSTTLPDGTLGYVKPIYIRRPCLNCHGQNIPKEVTETLQKHYPQDQAINYKLGEFRGLFWVEIE